MFQLKGRVERLNCQEKSLVTGYYRNNYNEYITYDITVITMIYIWLLDKFEDTINSSNIIQIKGINKNIVTKIVNKYENDSIFGKYIISKSNDFFDNYYHWKFQLLSNCNFQQNFNIGIIQNDKKNNNKHFIPLTDKILNNKKNDLKTDEYKCYLWKNDDEFDEKYDILDMYLDLNKGKLRYVVNYDGTYNEDHEINDIDTTLQYRMVLSIYA